MQCTLLIPDFWWAAASGTKDDPALPRLQTLLARARHRSFPPISLAAWLCQAFEVERQRDWPAAALTAAIDGCETGDAYWLRADPIHLQPHGDRLNASEPGTLALTHDEAAALADTIDRHLASDGMSLLAPHPSRWYLRLAHDPEIATCAPGDADGSSPWLPTGPQAPRWHRLCTEIQMLLHQHPVNAAREARGEPAINGLWLWGGGRHCGVAGRHFTASWSDDALVHALAAAADVPAAAQPSDAREWLAASRAAAGVSGNHLLTLTHLGRATCNGNAATWRHRMIEFDKQWVAPLVTAVWQRRIAAVALVLPDSAGCARFDLTWRELLRFWRSPCPYSAYAPTVQP